MNRRNFIKKGALFVPMIFVPKLIRARAFTFNDQAWLGTLNKQPMKTIPPPPLAAWYLDGNANDSSGNGHNGTLIGNPTFTTGANGLANGAISLDGQTQYIDLSNFADNLPNFSITAWFNTSGTIGDSADYTIISKFSDGGSNTGNGWVLSLEAGFSPVDVCLTGFVQQADGNVWVGNRSNTLHPNDGLWHFAAFTIANSNNDNPTTALYLDNSTSDIIVYNESTYSGATGFGNTSDVLIGNSTAAELFPGNLDDIRLYNTALSSDQVSAIYAAGPQ
jgi:Concanavalin A-like lectin/glucanases superfamily